MQEITVEAVIKNAPQVTAFMDDILASMDCSMKAQMQLDIAVDELFSNVAYYAYAPETGPITLQIDAPEDGRVVLRFIDEGIPYNPLEKKDPDTSLGIEERKIGGLGIFMVKKTMDEMRYEYRDGKNIVTLTKNIKE